MGVDDRPVSSPSLGQGEVSAGKLDERSVADEQMRVVAHSGVNLLSLHGGPSRILYRR
jgi:hypothetical protein